MGASRIPGWVYCDDHGTVHRDTCDPLPGLLPACRPEAHRPVLVDGEAVLGCARCGRPVDAAALVEALCPRCRERLAAEAAHPAPLRSVLPAWRDLNRRADLPSNAADAERMNEARWWKALQQALGWLDDDA